MTVMYNYLYSTYSNNAESIELVFGMKLRFIASASSFPFMIGDTNFFTSSGLDSPKNSNKCFVCSKIIPGVLSVDSLISDSIFFIY